MENNPVKLNLISLCSSSHRKMLVWSDCVCFSEVSVAGGGRLCLNSLKMSKHLRGVRAMPGPNNYQPFCASHKNSAITTNLSIKALWPLFVLKSDSFCFAACKHNFRLANSATCKPLENHSQLCLPSDRNMTSAERDSSFRMCSKAIAAS